VVHRTTGNVGFGHGPETEDILTRGLLKENGFGVQRKRRVDQERAQEPVSTKIFERHVMIIHASHLVISERASEYPSLKNPRPERRALQSLTKYRSHRCETDSSRVVVSRLQRKSDRGHRAVEAVQHTWDIDRRPAVQHHTSNLARDGLKSCLQRVLV
jgi:hypothetical protein